MLIGDQKHILLILTSKILFHIKQQLHRENLKFGRDFKNTFYREMLVKGYKFPVIINKFGGSNVQYGGYNQ